MVVTVQCGSWVLPFWRNYFPWSQCIPQKCLCPSAVSMVLLCRGPPCKDGHNVVLKAQHAFCCSSCNISTLAVKYVLHFSKQSCSTSVSQCSFYLISFITCCSNIDVDILLEISLLHSCQKPCLGSVFSSLLNFIHILYACCM